MIAAGPVLKQLRAAEETCHVTACESPLKTSVNLGLLEDVHSGFTELESRIGKNWQNHEDKEWRPDAPSERSSGLYCHDRRKDGVEDIEDWRHSKSNEDFPRC